MKERQTDVPNSTHLPAVGVFACGLRNQHTQHFQRWRDLVDVISIGDIVLLHDNAASDVGVITIARLDVIEPPRRFYLGALGDVHLHDPIVDVMIVHVFELRQPARDHLHWVEQLARAIAPRVRFGSTW